MKPMIEFTIDASSLEGYLENKAQLIITALRQQLWKEMVSLESYIKDDKLSGQMLSPRTGNLRNSGFAEISSAPGTMLGTVKFGRTARYARIHNYGGDINIPEVTGKLMVFERTGEILAGLESKYAIFTRKHRAFTVHMPARNYMETSLEEKEPEILANLQGAVEKAAKS